MTTRLEEGGSKTATASAASASQPTCRTTGGWPWSLARLTLVLCSGLLACAGAQQSSGRGDIKLDGDPMSRLILTVMAGVAEFERSLIVERTRLGLESARKRGKQLGRRVSRNAPSPNQVLALRDAGLSWAKVAGQLGCTPSAARRAADRLPERDPKSIAAISENCAA